MPKPVPLPPPSFDDLSVDEKIDYLQSLWDRIAATPERRRSGSARSPSRAQACRSAWRLRWGRERRADRMEREPGGDAFGRPETQRGRQVLATSWST